MDDNNGDRRLYTTPGGMARLRERLIHTRAAWFALCATNEDAAGSGDSSVWHDNFAYEENQRQMHQLAQRVRELEAYVDRMEVVPTCVVPPETVRVGSRVRVSLADDGQDRIFAIAGFADGDPAAGRVSYTSPLARSLVGAQEGDLRQVRVGCTTRDVEILEILAWDEEVPS